MNIYDFIRDPHDAVVAGYKYSLLDCWSFSANRIGKVYKDTFDNVVPGSWDIMDTTVRDIFTWIFQALVFIPLALIYPFTFWIFGTIVYFVLKGAPARQKAYEEKRKAEHEAYWRTKYEAHKEKEGY